ARPPRQGVRAAQPPPRRGGDCGAPPDRGGVPRGHRGAGRGGRARMMAEDELVALSTRELALYHDLAQAYGALLAVLEDPAASAAAPVLAEATARTERVTQALRGVSAALAPAR